MFPLWAFASVSNQPNCSWHSENGIVGSHPSFPTQKTKEGDEIVTKREKERRVWGRDKPTHFRESAGL